MTNRLGYFTIDTPDLDKARAFYSALLGWTFDAANSSPTYAHVQETGAPGEVAFGLCKGDRKDFSHLYIHVADIHALCARVDELGGRASIPAESGSGLSAVVRDDQGISLSLWQPAPGLLD
jgi:predicted enzyme related to lactoylglutathione lyase